MEVVVREEVKVLVEVEEREALERGEKGVEAWAGAGEEASIQPNRMQSVGSPRSLQPGCHGKVEP